MAKLQAAAKAAVLASLLELQRVDKQVLFSFVAQTLLSVLPGCSPPGVEDRSQNADPREAVAMEGPLALRGFYRRNLPHIVRCDRPVFVTFTTLDRWVLPPGARTLALRHALHEHRTKIFVDVAIIMPDHVHLIFTLLHDEDDIPYSLAEVMKGIKGVSARRINQLLGRIAPVWLDENFDHVVRHGERSKAKFQYVCDNAIRAGLVTSADEYPWLWRSWIEGRDGAEMQ